MATVIELTGVHYAYPDGGHVLNGIDLPVSTGEATVIFGASGSGKSTLAYLFNGLIPHFFGGRLAGTVLVDGVDTRDVTVAELFSKVGLVLQNVDAQLFNSTVNNDLAFGLESLGLNATHIDRRIRDTATYLQIDHLLDRSPDSLSGGEKRMAAIASVLCLDPDVVVLDEPFSGLDWKATRTVRNHLLQIPRNGRSLILIEHRTRPFLKEADRCVIIEEGRLHFDGAPDPALKILDDLHLVPQYPAREKAGAAGDREPLLSVRDLTCRLGGREILNGVSLDLRRNEALAIVGENGAGKTTLIKHFNGLLKPSSGEVLFKNRSIRNFDPLARAARVGLCFQNPNDQFFKTDVRSEILAGLRRRDRFDEAWLRRVCSALKLDPLMARSPYRLSEGEKRRVALAAVVLMKPEVLILDEPTAGQDGRYKESLAGVLADIAAMGVTPVVVTHDLDFAQAVADRWIWMRQGQIQADGDPEKIRAELETFYADQAAFALDQASYENLQ